MAEPEELSDEVKTFIVTELACYSTPSEVAKAVKAEFDLTVSRQRVHRYDPTAKAGAELSPQWRDLFEATRKALNEGLSESPVANKFVRVRMLNRAAMHFASIGNYIAMAEMLERAAKEMGEAYTNKQKHELSGKVDIAATATVILSGAPAAASSPEAMGGVPK